MPERLGVVDVVVVVLPGPADGVGADQGGGVVAGHQARVLAAQVERLGQAAGEQAVSLVAQPVDPLDRPGRGRAGAPGRRAAPSSRRRSSSRSRGIASCRSSDRTSPLAGVERGVGRGERAGGVEPAEGRRRPAGSTGRRRGGRGRRWWGGPVRGWFGAGDPRVDAAEIGPERVAADERLEVVVGVAGHERADDRQPVGQGRQAGERAAEGHAGDPRARPRPWRSGSPRASAIFGSNVSNWLGPPWRNRKMTDLPVSSPGSLVGPGSQGREVRQGQARRPDRDRPRRSGGTSPAAAVPVVVEEGEHGGGSRGSEAFGRGAPIMPAGGRECQPDQPDAPLACRGAGLTRGLPRPAARPWGARATCEVGRVALPFGFRPHRFIRG